MLKAAVTYFVLVFGAGFILGPIRILFVTPRLGERLAELLEAPVMLVVIIFSARWVFRKFPTEHPLAAGILALGLLLSLEFSLVLGLRGLTLADYFRQRDPVSGLVYYLMLLVFALMPFFIRRKVQPRNDSFHG